MNPPSEPPAREYRYLFGPVASRRFGRSLGIDLLPPKTCTEGCGFCEVGATTCLTVERREYVPADAVIAELRDWLARGGTADCLTLSGAGEPTLHSRFGDVLAAARAACGFRRVLLSNGTLMWLPEVRAAAALANVVKVSLSAWDEASFRLVNRPHPALRFAQIVDGLRALRREFGGELLLEVMLVAGANDADGDVARIAALAATVAPDRVQLNTVVRPPTDPAAGAVDVARLELLAARFTPRAEVIAPRAAAGPAGPGHAGRAELLALLRRRGCTLDEVARGLAVGRAEARRMLDDLLARGEARESGGGPVPHYRATD